ncbi:hypothetical protein [Alkaliphilus sp. B6464]|uniref:hypothetical protein n=1 Tax=Alkaliphilus sp. B6464 TaxID=2731219 RepID=UPI001BA79B75|nr:hypothetical protein [Alkaliphilus sp. B6464]QUH22165.1 hypothetical protein HYG84_19855 [Alkaliphilus sp. B6464]
MAKIRVEDYDNYFDLSKKKRLKKKIVNAKKNNHKHIYEPVDVKKCTQLDEGEDAIYMVSTVYGCEQCDKEVIKTSTLTKKELYELKVTLGHSADELKKLD